MTYRELLERSARLLGLRRLFIALPFQLIGLSKAFLALVSGYPRQLVSPLVESLKHSLVSRDLGLQRRAGLAALTFEQAVRESLAEEKTAAASAPSWPRRRAASASSRTPAATPSARSSASPCRRERARAGWPCATPPGCRVFSASCSRPTSTPPAAWSSASAACACRSWSCTSRGSAAPLPIASCSTSPAACWRRKAETPTRRPRLEFREVLDGSAALVAIHDYRPTLPWPLYNLTQARAHLWVMKNFARAVAARAG